MSTTWRVSGELSISHSSGVHHFDGFSKSIQSRVSPLAEWLECPPVAWETRVQSQVESCQRLKKWYLMPPRLTLSIMRYVSRVKWSNPGKWVDLSPTPQCSNYWKRNLWVTLDYGCLLYLLTLVWHKTTSHGEANLLEFWGGVESLFPCHIIKVFLFSFLQL